MKIKLKLNEIFNFSEMESSNYCSGTCATVSYKGDGYCDDENNNCGCDWDGGDCCNADTSFCSQCECLDPNFNCVETCAVGYEDYKGEFYLRIFPVRPTFIFY